MSWQIYPQYIFRLRKVKENIMELVSKGIIIVVYYVPVYVDASTACNDLTFALGTQANGVGAIATRQWSIKVRKRILGTADWIHK